MLDHYYDKLLQVARPPPALVRNAYLEAAMRDRAGPLLAVCLAYGETGQLPMGMIQAMIERCGLAQPAAGREKSASEANVPSAPKLA